MEPSGAARPSPEVVYQLAGALGTELQGLASRFGSETVARLVPHVVRALELLEGAAAGAPLELEEGKKEGEGTGGRAPRRPQPELRSENEEVRERLRDGPQDERLLLRQLKQVIDRQRDQLRAQRGELQLRGQEAEALQEQLQRLLRVNGELRCKLAAVQVQLRAALQRAAAAEGAPSQAGAPEAPEACAEASVAPVTLLPNPGVGEGQASELHSPFPTWAVRQLARASSVLPGPLLPPKSPGRGCRKLGARGPLPPGTPQLLPSSPAAVTPEWREVGPVGMARLGETQRPSPFLSAPPQAAPRGPGKDGFSREEVSQILQERNELKANVFLLQEELDYYHRELLADRRVPGLLLTAMKSAVKKQRRKIKAKMLGTVEEPGSR
ncbi:rab-interacting lysosomal protein isoform X2 [Antechinus flavipes]|uniref:rab-interacting lysosomal protein isoform X2 n=1 Tax=Antechinus flavipes TaxID=38775 RepID=UPI0022354B4D|nr:rab-interacting lysosomal protein isoform X2 [Antechinus flavipes]